MFTDLIYAAGKAQEISISFAEMRIASKFPASFAKFCFEYDGAKFRNAGVKAKSSKLGQSAYQVRQFWSVDKIGTVELEDWDTDLVAFAEDFGGNFFVFHKSDMNKVYFLDHETNDKEIVSESFNEFLSEIVETNNTSEPLAKNARGWVKSDFLKKQRDLGNA